MKPLVSIIVPVYNSEKTIKNCLTSICNQTYKNLEILVVYLKGSDNSLKVIQSIQDKRIRIIEQLKKTGPGGARNLGIKNARGKWIGFVEADDTISFDFYEKLLSAAIKNRCSIAQGEIVINGKQWTSFEKNKILASTTEKYCSLKNGASFDKLYSLDFIKENKIHFAENVRWEDNPFIFKAYYYGKIVTVKGVSYYYNPTCWTKEYRQKLKADIVPVCQEIMNFVQQIPLTQSELNLIKHKIITNFALSFIADKGVYQALMKLMDAPAFLFFLHYRKVIKAITKNFFNYVK